MKYEYYNPSLEMGGCISRAISKALNINYSDVKNDLKKLSIKLEKDDYHDIEVFDAYLKKNGFKKISVKKDELVKNLNLDNGTYIVFCCQDDFYHMTCIMDNTLYDNKKDSFNLKTITLYKLEK